MSLLEVGRIVRPHGIRGEVIVALVTNHTERLAAGTILDSDRGPMLVRASSPHQGRWIVAFDGVPDRSAAEQLRGTVLLAEPLPGTGELWVHELIDCRVIDTHGRIYGFVDAVEANPASDLLLVDRGGIVPLTFVVRHEPGMVVIDPPEGLIDPWDHPVEIVDPDPAWAARFDEEAAALRAALGDVAVRIDHVGSTSVPELAAKPIVDIQVSVADIGAADRYRPALQGLDYRFLDDPVFPDYPFFRKPRSGPPEFHVHVCEAGGAQEARHLAFRDRLRADADARREYEALKRRLAAEYGQDRLGYVEAKRAFIEALLP